ncbi:DUF2924 domain-containing protein [Candidatus Ferrigenium straubiae]|uniref:DUF2924 domain-containing protein n=1 Tax=Candidatus Ferrigenium straubiae TaxID=2919506 RepID=UPI003F4AD546
MAKLWLYAPPRNSDYVIEPDDLRQLRKGPSQKLAVGSRLIRVWQGETHQVMVLENGYSYAGKQWKSLSAIARAITGTPWSGPVFFGVKK